MGTAAIVKIQERGLIPVKRLEGANGKIKIQMVEVDSSGGYVEVVVPEN